MKVVIMGAGVIGVANAYYLAKEGHEVTVIDRQPAAGRETSFANAGLMAPGHATTWATPQAPITLIKSLFQEDTALRFKFTADPRFWIWSLYFLRNCTTARQYANTLPKLRLCLYSQEATRGVLEETGIDCDFLQKGILYLYRHAEHMEAGIRNMQFLKDNGHRQEVIDVDEVVRIDPALEPARDRLAGAIFGPDDESADAGKFTENLAIYCAETFGTTFRYETTVTGVRAEGGRMEAVVTDKGEVTGDLYVLSLGPYSGDIARKLGIRAPIYPIKGYSLTFPIDGHNGAPTVGGIDEERLVAWARIGDRVRLTATAEFSGFDTSYKPSDFTDMTDTIRDLFPDGADYEKPSYWACLRPMTPDGPPIFGRSARHENVFLNTGHGHMGWTMACGSGRVATDLILGREPEIDIKGMTLDRY